MAKKQGRQEICYNCKKEIHLIDLFCSFCKVVLPPEQTNYFFRFSLDISYQINLSDLEVKYLQLQQKLHPDFFVKKSIIEQSLSFKHSLLINEAYEILKDDLKRAEYILLLNNIIVNKESENKIIPPQTLLQEMLELRMDLEEADDDEKLIIHQNNKIAMKNIINEINDCFKKKLLQEMAILTMKLKYLLKVDEVN